DRKRGRVGKAHADVGAHNDGVDRIVVNILTEKMNVAFEPKPRHHVVHPVEAAQYGAFAAAGGPDETDDRPFWHRDAAVADREESSVEDLADVTLDGGFA